MADNKTESVTELDALGFLYRFLASLALVLFTFNPSGFSAYHWIAGAIAESSFGPLHLLLIAALLIGWTILLVATARSLSGFGIFLVALVLGGIIWLLIDIGLLAPDTVSGYTWIVLISLAVVLTIGLTWAHIWRRMTGQVSVDQIDE